MLQFCGYILTWSIEKMSCIVFCNDLLLGKNIGNIEAGFRHSLENKRSKKSKYVPSER